MITRTFLQAGANAADYIFDDSLIDFNSSNPVLKNILPASLLIKANYKSSMSLDYSKNSGDTAAVAFGGAGVSGGKLVLPLGGYVRYAGLNNVSAAIQTGTIEKKITPGYSNSPSNLSVIFILHQADGIFNNMIRIDHQTSGHLLLYMYNSSGAASIAADLGLWQPVADTQYQFSLNWDVTAGVTRLFIDREQFGPTVNTTLTRSSNVGVFQLGYDNPFSFAGEIDDVLVFDTVQHTADYGPEEVTTYSIANPTIKSLLPINSSQLVLVSSTSNLPTGTSTPFVIEVNGVDYWFNNTAWAISTGYPECNTSVTEAQLALLDLDGAAAIRQKYLFHTDDGEATPQLLSYTVGYLGHGFASITGTFLMPDGSVPPGGFVTITPVNLSLPPDTNTQVDLNTVIYLVNSLGNWLMPRIIIGVTYKFKFWSKPNGIPELHGIKKKVVNEVGDLHFNDLTDG